MRSNKDPAQPKINNEIKFLKTLEMSSERVQGYGSSRRRSPGFRASVQLGLGYRKELRSGVQQTRVQGPAPRCTGCVARLESPLLPHGDNDNTHILCGTPLLWVCALSSTRGTSQEPSALATELLLRPPTVNWVVLITAFGCPFILGPEETASLASSSPDLSFKEANGLCHPSPQVQVPAKVWAPGPMRRGPGSGMPGVGNGRKREAHSHPKGFHCQGHFTAPGLSFLICARGRYLLPGGIMAQKSTPPISQTPAIPGPVTGLFP